MMKWIIAWALVFLMYAIVSRLVLIIFGHDGAVVFAVIAVCSWPFWLSMIMILIDRVIDRCFGGED